MAKHFQRLTSNFVGARKRYETLDGKQYLVVPIVMLTEGVHEGSAGPLYYPPDEMSKNPVVWNSKPVVIEHPVVNGEGVTACDPTVLESQSVGMMLNTAYDGRLRTEGWMVEEKLAKLAPAVLTAINAGNMVEVSTGLFHDLEIKEGVWKGEKYVGIVRNMQPDHLAILLNQKGACSIADGAGLLRNADGSLSELCADDVRSQAGTALRSKNPRDYVYVQDVYPKHVIASFDNSNKSYKIPYKISGGKVDLAHDKAEEVHRVTTYVTANGQYLRNEDALTLPAVPSWDQLSEDMKKQLGSKALSDLYGEPGADWSVQIYGTSLIWLKNNKLFRLPYNYEAGKITLTGDPEEVMSTPPATNSEKNVTTPNQQPLDVRAATLLANAFKINPAQAQVIVANAIMQGTGPLIEAALKSAEPVTTPTPTPVSDPKEAQVDVLIANGKWQPADRAWLISQPDDALARILRNSGISPTLAPTPMTNAQQPLTDDQWLAAAPPTIRKLVANAAAAEKVQRDNAIRVITNANPKFNPAWLQAQSTDQLEALAALARPPQHALNNNYGGQASVPMFVDTVVTTTNAGTDNDVLPMPSMFGTA